MLCDAMRCYMWHVVFVMARGAAPLKGVYVAWHVRIQGVLSWKRRFEMVGRGLGWRVREWCQVPWCKWDGEPWLTRLHI